MGRSNHRKAAAHRGSCSRVSRAGLRVARRQGPGCPATLEPDLPGKASPPLLEAGSAQRCSSPAPRGDTRRAEDPSVIGARRHLGRGPDHRRGAQAGRLSQDRGHPRGPRSARIPGLKHVIACVTDVPTLAAAVCRASASRPSCRWPTSSPSSCTCAADGTLGRARAHRRRPPHRLGRRSRRSLHHRRAGHLRPHRAVG